MADIAASDITYTVTNQGRSYLGRQGWAQKATVVFGDAALTYPTGGVVLDKAKFGFKRELSDVIFGEANAGDGFIYKFDKSTGAIRIYDTVTTEYDGGVDAPAATTLEITAIGQ